MSLIKTRSSAFLIGISIGIAIGSYLSQFITLKFYPDTTVYHTEVGKQKNKGDHGTNEAVVDCPCLEEGKNKGVKRGVFKRKRKK
ncbi:MAG: hypothetical protein AB8B61_00495 [Cyclobacteriaceae bacterium]